MCESRDLLEILQPVLEIGVNSGFISIMYDFSTSHFDELEIQSNMAEPVLFENTSVECLPHV